MLNVSRNSNSDKKITKLIILVKSIDGGTGTFVLNLLKIKHLFKKNRLQINVLTLEFPSYRHLEKNDRDQFHFLYPSKFYPIKYYFSFKNIVSFIREIFFVRHYVKDYKPDVVLSVDLHCNLITVITKLLFYSKLKTVLTTHIDLKRTIDDKSTGNLIPILNNFVKRLYNNTDCHICVSKQLSKKVMQDFHLSKKPIVIYNGLTKNYKNRPRLLPVEKKVIISVARLFEQKDHETLIKAFSAINKRLLGCELWLLSDGPLKDRLLTLTQELSLSPNVRFFGWVKNIYPYLNRSYLFVLSSKREGFSYALLEAMSQGLPVISTNTPFGPSEILGDGKYGILVPSGNEKAISQAIYELLIDAKKYLYYSEKALERSKFFSEEKMLKAYKKVILDVLNNK